MRAEVTILQTLVDYTYDLVTAHTSTSFTHACDRDLWRRLTALHLSRAFTTSKQGGVAGPGGGLDDTGQTSEASEASEIYCMLPVVDLANHALMPHGQVHTHSHTTGGAAASPGTTTSKLEGGRSRLRGNSEPGPNVMYMARAADGIRSRTTTQNGGAVGGGATSTKGFDTFLVATRSIAKHEALLGSYTSNGEERELPGLKSTNTALLLNFGMALPNNARDFVSCHGTRTWGYSNFK